MKWRDGYPELCCVDDTPCRDPTRRGQWLPPTISSHSVLVELDDEAGVAIDRAIAMGDGKATWYIYGNRVTGWMPLPKARRATINNKVPDSGVGSLGPKRQRGCIQVPSTGDLLGCFAVVAVFFVVVGVALAVLMPKVWHWVKPIIQGWLA